MKNKNKFYLFFSVFLFWCFFFGEFFVVNAADCTYCDEFCANNACSATEYSECVSNTCPVGVTPSQSATTCPAGYHLDSLGTDCISDTKTDCSSYQNTHAVNGLCECDNGYVRNADGSCSAGGANVCLGNYDTAECCSANRGYWYNSTCNTDPNAGTVGNACSSDFDCNTGYKCDSTGTCMADGFFSGTECNTDGDCQGIYGSGYTCSGVFVRTCEKTSNSVSAAGTAVGETTTAMTLANGVIAPLGTIVYADGSGVSPSGVSYPAGSFSPPTSSNGNFSIITGGGVGSSLNCGLNFTKIGGVCFPTNTGLANPTGGIGQIIANLFFWLMGIFMTLAVLAFVVSGIQYLLAAGDEDLAKSAKKNAVNAIIGIIVGLSGFIIIQAISRILEGANTLI
ncbi:MAG: pilin [bacterium]